MQKASSSSLENGHSYYPSADPCPAREGRRPALDSAKDAALLEVVGAKRKPFVNSKQKDTVTVHTKLECRLGTDSDSENMHTVCRYVGLSARRRV